MAQTDSPLTRIESASATILEKAPTWVDQLFGWGTIFVAKYSKYLVVIGGILAISTVFKWQKRK